MENCGSFVNMESENSEEWYRKNWEVLKEGFIKLLETNKDGFRTTDYMNLYSLTVKMVDNNFGNKLYTGMQDVIKVYLAEIVRSSIMDASNFLSKLTECSNDFTSSMIWIRGAFSYLNNHYVLRHDLLSVDDLLLHLFREEIFQHPTVDDRIKTAIFDVIELTRKAEHVEHSELNAAFEVLLAFGLDKKDFFDESLFLQKSTDFYKSTCLQYLQNGCEYVRKVYDCLIIEENHVAPLMNELLDPSTYSKWKTILIQELITGHIKAVTESENSGLVFMMKNECFEEINLLYCLLERVPNGTSFNADTVVKQIEEYVITQLPVRWSESLVKINEFLSSYDFVEYMQNLIILEKDLQSFAERYFKVQSQLSLTVQDGIQKLLNPDPKLLSLCIDHHLRKKNMNENDTFNIVEESMKIFRYVSEKDVFEKYYKTLLSKRLLFHKSCSYDSEKFVISSLKNECGIDFTKKMEAMLKDIEISNELNKSFKAETDDKSVIDFSVQVLTKCYWPISNIQSCILPFPAENVFNKFKDFYLSKHSGRELTIAPSFGFADLKATFYKKDTDQNTREETKTLIVTTFQMCVLMKFNESEFFTFKELLNGTKISEQDLKRTLTSMAMGKESQRVLVRMGNGSSIEKEDIFSVNDKFSSKLNRIRIQPVSVKAESNKSEENEIRAKNDDDRKYEIEAAIIRIMKSRQKLIHNELIVEVTKQLQPRFLPDPLIIKKRIEALIEREYLKRDENDFNLYHYIS